ncbi:MAG: hypothetical protein LBV23_11235 [Deltaproteobacteria bacterium]|jgi:hypothetical protein|nr:hypothetical protein [Deltaproteobacteria bacterium]
MKKFLALFLGAILVANAAPSLAASKIDFSGYFKIFHSDESNFTRHWDNNQRDEDHYFANKIQMNVSIKPTDDIEIRWVIRGPDNYRWGATAVGTGALTNVITRSLHVKIKQPWGTFYVGRIADNLPGNVGGLYTLGYRKKWGNEWLHPDNIFDISAPVDGIAYDHDFGNGWGLQAYYAKWNHYTPLAYITSAAGVTTQNGTDKDRDRDVFGIEPRYKWDGGGASLGIEYIRNMNTNGATVTSNYGIIFNPAFMHKWGAFSIHFEGKVGWGKTKFVGNTTTKSAGLGLYLDANYDYGSGDVTLMGFYIDGTKRNGKVNNLFDLGDFAPFIVAFNKAAYGQGTWTRGSGWTGSGNQGWGTVGNRASASNSTEPKTNIWGVGLLGNQSLNDDIKFNYGFGYFGLVRANPGWSKSLGFEIDLGATFQLLDNLQFESQFGYMFSGNAYKRAVSGPSPKDTFTWLNVLAVTF